MRHEAKEDFGVNGPSKLLPRGLPRSSMQHVVPPFVAFCVLVLFIFFMSSYLSPRYSTIINSNRPQEPAAWDVQLALAQQEATKVYTDAVLYEIYAFPHGWLPNKDASYEYTISDSLVVGFEFVSSSGAVIEVSFQDTAPTTTLHLHQNQYLNRRDVWDQREKYADAIKRIKLSPRDAIQRTWQDATVQVPVQGVDIVPFVRLNTNTTPVSWEVHYRTPGILEFYYEVDAQDGNINQQLR